MRPCMPAGGHIWCPALPCLAAIFVQWCLPWLGSDRISRLVLLNTGLPPHTLLRELGLANALLITIWQLAVMLVGRYVQVGRKDRLTSDACSMTQPCL